MLISLLIVIFSFLLVEKYKTAKRSLLISSISFLTSVAFFGIFVTPSLSSFIHSNRIVIQNNKEVNLHVYSSDSTSSKIVTPNQVNIIYFWTSSCGICFNSFPKFDSVMNKYKNDSRINYYALGLVNRKETIGELYSLFRGENLEFDSFFVNQKDSIIVDYLNVRSVPKLIITNYDKKIIYDGVFSIVKTDYFNIDKIIKREFSKLDSLK